MSGDSIYCYPPDFTVLKNIPGHRDQSELERFERRAVVARIREGVPIGGFDLDHLKVIHRQLFQDVYPWAGEIRTTPLAKSESVFMPPDRIETAMGDVHRRLEAQDYLRGISQPEFARAAGEIIGDVNFTHPFREGNGRTQFQYLKQLARGAGHEIDLSKIEPKDWIGASIAANRADYGPMARCIANAFDKSAQTKSP